MDKVWGVMHFSRFWRHSRHRTALYTTRMPVISAAACARLDPTASLAVELFVPCKGWTWIREHGPNGAPPGLPHYSVTFVVESQDDLRTKPPISPELQPAFGAA